MRSRNARKIPVKSHGPRSLVGLLLIASVSHSAHAAPPGGATNGSFQGDELRSPSTRTNLVELFSSEGCSSCPPADDWLASLRLDPNLWKSFVPVEFHVDYWNRLGWTDRYSKESFTLRQHQYASEWASSHVYTPAFVLNGSEWRAGNKDAGLALPGEEVGILTIRKTGEGKFKAMFSPKTKEGKWIVYGALLGNGLSTEVRAGENQGRTLRHEFVVLSLDQKRMRAEGTSQTADVEIEAKGKVRPGSYSVAFWVSKEGSQEPIQAVGGVLR